MSEEFRVKHECGSCNGTGLYVGMGEHDGAAVVCSRCEGVGWQKSTFKKFTGRKNREGIVRVFQANPGTRIWEDGMIKLSDFGGMPFADWVSGKPFTRGMEDRSRSCPAWWAQSTGGRGPGWVECRRMIGRPFSSCERFCCRETCWARWDEEMTEEI